jgi:putative Mn2+ efflux pump MntP
MSLSDVISILLTAFSLSADCFAVALAGSVSLKNFHYVQVFRTALAFGGAQAVMPAIGWAVGRVVTDYIGGFDHWVAFGLLAIVGGHMIWEALHEKEETRQGADISRGLLLFTLAIATSIDALAVGLSFALEQINIMVAVLVIGVIAFLITNLGFYLGRKAGSLLGERAKIIGGIVLIGIGVKILVSHLFDLGI